MTDQINPLLSAIEYFGGNQSALARALKVERMLISNWKTRGSGVPADRWFDIERVTKGAVKARDFYEYAKK